MLVEDETEEPRPAPENNRGKGFGVSRVPLRSSHKEFVDIDFLGYDIIHRHITGMNTSKHVSPRMAFYLVSSRTQMFLNATISIPCLQATCQIAGNLISRSRYPPLLRLPLPHCLQDPLQPLMARRATLSLHILLKQEYRSC